MNCYTKEMDGKKYLNLCLFQFSTQSNLYKHFLTYNFMGANEVLENG